MTEDLLKEIETLRMQLAGCGVAALMNTEKSKKDRITRDNPYWTASYGDVCNAVDREIELRSKLDIAVEALEYYADTKIANVAGVQFGVNDHGNKAKEALAQIKETK